jgi:hypothetical protein
MMSETSITQILEHGVGPDMIYGNTEVSIDSFYEMINSD